MASPQKENGHTGIANEILEQLMKSKFNGSQFRILICILRQTYGFQRKEHRLSVSFISKATGLDARQTRRDLANLIEDKVITVIEDTDNRNSRIISFNKDYEKWFSEGESTPEGKSTPSGEPTPTPEGKVTPPSGGEPTPQINKKEIIKEIIGFWLSKNLVKHRTITPHMEQQVNWKLNGGFTKQQLMESIANYDSIVNDKEYKLEQKWGLDVFFMNHFEKFLTERNPFSFYPKIKPTPIIDKSRTSIPATAKKIISQEVPLYSGHSSRENDN